MASGIFIVPILTSFGQVDIHTAIGASIVSVIACSCGSAAPFLRGRLTNIKLAIVLEVATTLGAITGVLLTGIVPTNFLFVLFSMVLVVSAIQMLMRRKEAAAIAVHPNGGWGERLELNASYFDRERQQMTFYSVTRVPMGLVLMYGAGLISALLGIGSGVLKIPAMDTALRLPIKVSSATSNFMIGVTAAASAGAYFVRGDISPSVAGPVVLGSVIGSIAGARYVIGASSDRLRVLFIVILLVLAAQMLLNVFGVHLGGRIE